ncbi:MAG TPA: universal stress protein [Candidatus Angelobacter sp.]|nr:universal stress protein [Candidatus Angelobacter sp.]
MATKAFIPIIPAIQLKRILYATDFSEGSRTAFGVVAAIARRYHAEVLAAHICLPATSTMEEQRERESKEDVARLLRVSESLNISINPIVKSGDPVQELSRIVQDEHVDLAVLTTHGRTGLKHLMMGSVAEALVRKLPCPVLTVGPYLEHRFQEAVEVRNILIPTDLSEESMVVFPYLASLAHENGARITVLHVLPPETAGNPDAKKLAEFLRNEMMRICPEISPRCEADFLIEAGDAAERILACARDRKVELIGLGIRKAGGMTTHFRNTATYRVLLQAGCPVLTHRFHHPRLSQ